MTFAFILESVGGTEWLVLLGVVLIVVGPKNLPAAARKMGQIMSTLRRAADEFKRQLMAMDQEVTKVVNETTSDASSSDNASSSTAASGGDAASENGEDLYGEDNPYPGYEEYYDETQYEDGADTAADNAAEGVVETRTDEAGDAAKDGTAAAGKHVPTDAELRAIKITVTTNSSPGKGSGA